MSLSSLLDSRPEVSAGFTADLQGRVLETVGSSAMDADESAADTAAAVSGLAAAGAAAGLTRLELLLVKGPGKVTVTAVRPDTLLWVTVDPAKGTAEIERVLQSWSPEPTPASPPPGRAAAAAPAPPAAASRPAAGDAAPASPRGPLKDGPWALLRRALVRAQLTEASARLREIGTAPAAAVRPGDEPTDAPERERGLRILLEGIGSVMAGDGLGGSRTLGPMTDASQRNLSFRWVALHWSTWAALRSGSVRTARVQVKEALTIARQLNMEARAVSQWTAAEVLAHDGDPARAIAFLNEARARFERLGDRWGLGQTRLSEARIMASTRREEEGERAAREAWSFRPEWDEPPTFLARRALMRDDLPAAEEILRPVRTPAADRVRTLIEAIRQGTVAQDAASEFLKEQDAPPSEQAIRTLERIAGAWPGFDQAREVLAWMLLKLGRYPDASTIFRGLLTRQLTPADRASVMLGLGCIAHAQKTGDEPEARLHAVVNASEAPPPSDPTTEASSSSLPALGSSLASANSGSGAVFSGQLSVFALPDLLEFLRSGRRTGLLVCSSAAGMGALRFRDGKITEAASPSMPGLGQLLVDARKISTLSLSKVASRQDPKQPGHLLGEQLVREGLVEVAAVEGALARQIELTIRELVPWKDGEFAFNQDGEDEAAATGISVALDPQAVLLDVFKEMDEASRQGA